MNNDNQKIVDIDHVFFTYPPPEKTEAVKDVTIKSYSLLSHTPVDALGINFEGHWKFKDSADKILRNLFAKGHNSFTKALGDDYQIGGVITSYQKNRKTTLKIDVSNILQDGIFFNVNFHREIKTRQAEQATQLISEKWLSYQEEHSHN